MTKRGRPAGFDRAEALHRAMELFWARGYEGTTLDELTAAMGINRPSLYAAFGDKEQLFRRALDRYVSGPAGYVREALARPNAHDAAETLLAGAVALKGWRVLLGRRDAAPLLVSALGSFLSTRAALKVVGAPPLWPFAVYRAALAGTVLRSV